MYASTTAAGATQTINIDSLFEERTHTDLHQLKHFTAVLEKTHSKIRREAAKHPHIKTCKIIVPPFVIGSNKYDQYECTQFIMKKLQTNGFDVCCLGYGRLDVSWARHIAPHIRMEYTKQTGIVVDSFGRPVHSTSSSSGKTASLKERLSRATSETSSDADVVQRRPNEPMVMQPIVDKHGNYMAGNSRLNNKPLIVPASKIASEAVPTPVADNGPRNQLGKGTQSQYTPLKTYVPSGKYGVYDESVLNLF